MIRSWRMEIAGRSTIAFIVVITAQFCGGCGLVVLPSLESVPSPVRKVAVRDANTKQSIPSAQVACWIVSVDTKTNLFDKSASRYSFWDASRKIGDLPVHRDGGVFVLQHRVLLAVWQDLWPLAWATSGDWHYHGYRAKINASAPGYLPEQVDFPSDASPDEFADHAFRDGTLTLFLRARAIEPSSHCPPKTLIQRLAADR